MAILGIAFAVQPEELTGNQPMVYPSLIIDQISAHGDSLAVYANRFQYLSHTRP